MYHVGIIGAGKVGLALGLYLFTQEPLIVTGFYSRTASDATYAAKRTNTKHYDTMEELVGHNDVILITTPDDAIPTVWSQLQKLPLAGKIIGHCSGSLSSHIFLDSTTKQVDCCSLHPLLAIANKDDAYRSLGGAFFTLEGSPHATNLFAECLKAHGNAYKILSSADKRAYHLATVYMSNLMLVLGHIALDLLTPYGFSEEEARQALTCLSQQNLNNFLARGAGEALTGPIERNDVKTVEGHLAATATPETVHIQKLYAELSRELVTLAKKKHPERDYRQIEDALEKGATGFIR